ncbi:uncharacterized protein MELLADRAFT_66009 [Melampsora larici-populina 98AG31]|uniref:Uncharacterized protein n=1 Tax=Melampsora larici-populina (strain 98AG31 / pathotype 3-4-7) TaxID=747676 RepID=F4RXI8_MELLP|nr:uncharacterized protein MELLADRAFT_66009 [Melampsora larici-populina 98AG31]EGG02972.1 hypothetical protein MELLADRAFT_66009 [Melampsora larici-populina 98AG31]
MTRHVRVLKASANLENPGILNRHCLIPFRHIAKDFLEPLSKHSVKHIILLTPSDDEPIWRTWFNDPANSVSQDFKNTYGGVMLQTSHFPLLTSLEISGTCYAFMAEDDIAEYVWKLPNLIRFRAHSTATLSFPTRAHNGQLDIRLPEYVVVDKLFQSLQSFEVLGTNLDDNFFSILSGAPKLKKLHIYLQNPPRLIERMKDSIANDDNTWPSLRSVILSNVVRTNPQRIWLENWGNGRDPPVNIRFHQSQRLPDVPGQNADQAQQNPQDQHNPEATDGDNLSDGENSELSVEDWTSSSWLRDHE